MAQVFPRQANDFARASLVVGGIVAAVVLGSFFFVWPRSSYMTRQREARAQPVPFYHLHHVGGMGIDCRYCHTSVDKSATAGIPPTKTCMNCHSQIFNQSPTLEPVRASWRSGESIEWTKVHDLPDFVYFNHSAHVNKGVGCTTCHATEDDSRKLGPTLKGAGKRLGKGGLYEAILVPDATITAGTPPYPGGLMTQTLNGNGFYQRMTPKDYQALVDYLAKL